MDQILEDFHYYFENNFLVNAMRCVNILSKDIGNEHLVERCKKLLKNKKEPVNPNINSILLFLKESRIKDV